MEMQDEVRIPAPRDQVYAGLNDPEILKQCIPGCEELVKHSDTELEAKVQLKVGPVKAKFGGTVTLDPSNAPERFSLSGEGNGGMAGFAKGGADVELEEDGDETILRYNAKADIGGKLAQLGGHLVEKTSKKLAAEFFQNFEEILNPGSQEAEAVVADSETGDGSSNWLWITGGALALIVIALLVFLIPFDARHPCAPGVDASMLLNEHRFESR